MMLHTPTFLSFTVLGLTAMLVIQPAGDRSPAPPRAAQPGTTPNPPVKQPKIVEPIKTSTVRDDTAAEKLGWRLGVQAWTFRDRSTEETIDIAHRLGIKYIELYSGQVISKSEPDVKVGVDLTAEQIASLRKKLADGGVKAVSFGVTGFKNDEKDARKTFEFAKAMGLENIACEPDADAWDVLSKLADEYKINIACHNHPKPSRYWNPDTVLEAVKSRSSRLGACADTGHWKRSGLDPVACLTKFSGRIFELHFKDIKDDKDEPWGTGECDAKAMLGVLAKQGFKGAIFVEYESTEGKVLDENVRKCVEFFDVTAAEIAGKTTK
ncbi:MAG: sugar phosphate isomerase/epimerase [Pyrinomonadaceae bacterium]|nr:sugar phosphate isomerase/epimerase [Phycisphaerales bacterium]